MEQTNFWKKINTPNNKPASPSPFTRIVEDAVECRIDESWRRVMPVVNELRNSVSSELYEQRSIDTATIAAARFVCRMPDDLLEQKQLIDFDIQMEESVEMVFSGRQKVRVNLMLESMNTQEEAFIFYQMNGRMTQTNGYMSDVIEILKRVL